MHSKPDRINWYFPALNFAVLNYQLSSKSMGHTSDELHVSFIIKHEAITMMINRSFGMIERSTYTEQERVSQLVKAQKIVC